MQKQLWTVNALGVELNRDRRTIARLLEDLEPDKVEQIGGGRTSKKWYMHRVFEHLLSPPAAGGEAEYLNLDQERARHSKEQADKLALENAEARGELVYVEHMVEIMGRSITAFRQRLRNIPNHAASHLPTEWRARTHKLVSDLIDQALHEMADYDPGATDSEQSETGSNGKRRKRLGGAPQ